MWERGEELVTVRGVRVTPGIGLRFATPLGPVRIDAAYNGYQTERGPLLFLNDTTKTVTQFVAHSPYPPRGAQKRFWQKIVIQVAVGQAF